MGLWADALDRLGRDVRDTFGVRAMVSDGQQSISAMVIVDAAWVEVPMEAGQAVSTLATVITLREADIPWQVRAGHRVTVGGKTYRVDDAQLDGGGMVRCIVSVAA